MRKSKYIIVILVLIFLLFAIYIPARSKQIKAEGPRIVELIEKYKNSNSKYPDRLTQLQADIKYSPVYIHNEEDDQYLLSYSIFVFHRWVYSSRDKIWKDID